MWDYKQYEPKVEKVVTKEVEVEVEVEVVQPLTLDEIDLGLGLLAKSDVRNFVLDALEYSGNEKTFKMAFDNVCDDTYKEALLMLDECDLSDALKEELISDDIEVAVNAKFEALDIMLKTDSIVYGEDIATWNAFNPHHTISLDDLELDGAGRKKPSGVYKTISECKGGDFDRRKQKCVKAKTTKFGGVKTAYKRELIEGAKLKMTSKERLAKKRNAKKMGKKHKSSTSIKKGAKARGSGDE